MHKIPLQGQDAKNTEPEENIPEENILDKVLKLLKTLAIGFVSRLQTSAERLAQQAVQRSLQEVDRSLGAFLQMLPAASMRINIASLLSQKGLVQRTMDAAVRTNAELIRSIPAQFFDKVSQAVHVSVIAGQRHTTLAKEIMRLTDVTERRAKLIARDQISKMQGALTQVRQQSAGFAKYLWSTSQDERVRLSHAANDGKLFFWDRPPVTGHPGADVNCRCVAIPYVPA